MKDAEIPAAWSQVAADIMVSKYFRKAGVPQDDADGKPLLDDDGNAVTGPGALRQAGDRPARRHLALVGRDQRLLRHRRRRPRLRGRAGVHARSTRWPRPTPRSGSTPASTTPTASPAPPRASATSTRRPARLTALARRLHPPRAARLLHPARQRRPGRRGGIMDLGSARPALFKYGSGTGSNFSSHPRRGRDALRRRQVVRADELPQDRRPRRRRHQVGRHHPARRQDGRSSTSTTPTSRPSSTGRPTRRRRSRR